MARRNDDERVEELEDGVRVWEQLLAAHSATYHDGGGDPACPICEMLERGVERAKLELFACVADVD